jgi:hypothetical protein
LTNPEIAEERDVNINIQPKDKDPSNLSIGKDNLPTIHISVKIAPAENDTSCFTTDGDAGRFAIIANDNKNTQKSTAPGQFYYNILWTNNTGASQIVNVNFARIGVTAQGKQAIHAYVFPAPFSGVSQADFQTVNNSMPGGSDDSIQNITVPAGWTLWANYHLEWADLGSQVPSDIATICDNANQILSITGTISGGVDRVCMAGAKGYKK